MTLGKPIVDEDLISHILRGLSIAYTPFISNCYFAQREKSLSLIDFQSKLFAFEALLETQQRSVQVDHNNFAMIANKLGGKRIGKRIVAIDSHNNASIMLLFLHRN